MALESKCTPEQVSRLIQSSRCPLIFRGLIDSWPMFGYSTSDWELLFANRMLECRVGLKNSGDVEPQWEGRCETIECSYSQLIQWSQGGGGFSDLLQPQKHFLYYGYKYMKDVFEDESVLKSTDWKEFGYPGRNGKESTFWLGTAGAHTPCHYDTYGCNLVAQVSGRKRWILYPPEDTPHLQASRVPYEESSVYSRINFEAGLPSIRGTHPHVVDLNPGEVLYVPRHWWHFVTNLELSVSINTWLERPEDEEARLQEGLVKFFVSHVGRNLPPHVLPELLNPNEEIVEDLEEIEGIIQHSVSRVRSSLIQKEKEVEIPSEPWVLPVVYVDQVGMEPDRKKPCHVGSTDVSVDVLEIVRAFCHPRVIETVSQILKGDSSENPSNL